MKVAVIGGGAAGFFAAIQVKNNYPDAHVTLFERTQKLLSKVKISGGGRCNVTNACPSRKDLLDAYPRGRQLLKKAFYLFDNKDAMRWFESKGIPLKVEANNHVFPISNSSQSIIDCFLKSFEKHDIKIELGAHITNISSIDNERIKLEFRDSEKNRGTWDAVIVATGGSPKKSGLQWLEDLGHHIEDPVPSLFTFNMPKEPITKLMGVVADHAVVRIQGTKLKAEGPLLITHWGMSGPAILKLSAFGARTLSINNYEFIAQVNWINIQRHEDVLSELINIQSAHSKKQMGSIKPFNLPARLWAFLLEKSEIPLDKKWQDIGKKSFHKLVSILTNDNYQVRGKTTFKEEFVTCGGVSLSSINKQTMESKSMKNVFFTGEVMDIDGITGGYNFQAAWTTAFIAGKLEKKS